MRSNLWLAASLVVLAGCGGGNPPRSDIWYGAGNVPAVSQNNLHDILPGAAIAGLIPGQDVGYYITANQGGSFRLVWTGDLGQSGQSRRFQGSVWTRGTFVSKTDGCEARICPLETDDLISAVRTLGTGGQRIDWDTFATDGLDGFDFIADNLPVFFQLRIDFADRADLTFFPATGNGGRLTNPAGMPFGLTPR